MSAAGKASWQPSPCLRVNERERLRARNHFGSRQERSYRYGLESLSFEVPLMQST